jgi:hypothetical protein
MTTTMMMMMMMMMMVTVRLAGRAEGGGLVFER